MLDEPRDERVATDERGDGQADQQRAAGVLERSPQRCDRERDTRQDERERTRHQERGKRTAPGHVRERALPCHPNGDGNDADHGDGRDRHQQHVDEVVPRRETDVCRHLANALGEEAIEGRLIRYE